MTTETTALTVQQRAAVALSSSKAEAELIELAGKSKSITVITNADGRKECHAAAMVAKEARIAVEKAAKAAREDATAFSKAVIAEEKRLVDLIAPEEGRLLALRDDWDAKAKAEKEAKEAAERARVAGIKEKIELIRRGVTNAALLDAAGAKAILDLTEATQIDDSFAEFYGEAMEVRGEAIAKLREIAGAKAAAEAEAARIKAEQEAEAERLRQEREELARQRAEQERVEAQARAKREEEDRKTREAMEAQAAELKRQQEELDRQRSELEAAKQKEAEASAQQQAAQVIEAAKVEKVADDAAAAKCIAPIIAAEIAARQEETAATLKLGEINAALGVVSITADQLAALGFKPHTTDKSAKLYLASHFPLICAALVRHITAVANAPMKLAA